MGSTDSSKTTFVPLMVSMGEPPDSYTSGTPAVLDRGAAYWAHRYVQNLAQIRYSSMIVDIKRASSELEEKGAAVVASLLAGQTKGGTTPKKIRQLLAGHARCPRHDVAARDDLMVKYVMEAPTPLRWVGRVLGYPEDWPAPR